MQKSGHTERSALQKKKQLTLWTTIKHEPPTFCTNCEVTVAKKGVKCVIKKPDQLVKKKTLDALIKTTYNALKAKQSSTPDFTTCKKKKKDATETRTTWSLSVQKEKKTDVTKNTVTIKNFIFFEANIFFLSSLLSCTSRVFKLSMSCAHLSRPKT